MTSANQPFKSDLDDSWYFWSESWELLNGPYQELVDAQEAISKQLRDKSDEA